ncbi:MAG: GerMN domain-containing protein [Candidatus Gastranaerophilales bacterium]|nr:GerMN domain-containing protein [Candidatus Gastranaerophilales bacterium]
MVRFIFWVLTICTLFLVIGFIAKDKFDLTALEDFNIDKITGSLIENKKQFPEKSQQPAEEETKPEKKDNTVEITLLKIENGNPKYIKTTKNINPDEDEFERAMKELFSGANTFEKISGVYSEIPKETKLLGIKKDANSYTINISEDFEYGGGADSMKARVKQLVETATKASGGKDVYLEINGKRVEVIGGEGIIIKQPLAGNLQ